MRAVARRVGHAQRGPIDAVERQAAPGMPTGALLRPRLGAARKQPFHWLVAQASARLGHRRVRDGPFVGRGHRQIELVNHVVNRPVAHQRHTEHEPNHLLGRQSSPSQRRRPRRRQRLLDPGRLDRTPKTRKLLGRDLVQQLQRRFEARMLGFHRPILIPSSPVATIQHCLPRFANDVNHLLLM